jgi:hypothetical protein
MTKKQGNGVTYILGNFDEVKQFCDKKNLTILKAPKERLTETGHALFENYEYYTTIQDYEYMNCGIRQKVKYNRVWEFDEVQNDWYSFTEHIYMNEYERMNGIN